MRIFPVEVKDDGLYVTIRLDEDEYERLAKGQHAKDWDTEHQTVKGNSLPGEVAVFLEALGEHIAGYARVMSES